MVAQAGNSCSSRDVIDSHDERAGELIRKDTYGASSR